MNVDQFRFLPKSFRPLFESPARLPGEDHPIFTPLRPRLQDARIALLSSAGLYLAASQEPYDEAGERRVPTWGDPSWRPIPRETQQGELASMHLHINPADLLADHEIALPLRCLDEFVASRIVGSSAPTHYSVMGYQEEGLKAWSTQTAPEIVNGLRAEEVDGLVLSPACPGCSTNVPALARAIEAAGIPTVLVTPMPAVAVHMLTPRIVGVEFPFGHAFGQPGDRAMQHHVLLAALRLLAGATEAVTRLDLDLAWPISTEVAYRQWQPSEPAPLVQMMIEQAKAARTR